MNTKKVIGFALLGFAVWKYSQPPRRIVPPPRPPGSYQNNYAQWLAYAQNIIAQAKQLYGSGQQVYQALFGPGGVFYKEPLPTYDAGSQFWQDAGAQGLAGIGMAAQVNIRTNENGSITKSVRLKAKGREWLFSYHQYKNGGGLLTITDLSLPRDRQFGKTYTSFEEAENKYKSPDMQLAIFSAQTLLT